MAEVTAGGRHASGGRAGATTSAYVRAYDLAALRPDIGAQRLAVLERSRRNSCRTCITADAWADGTDQPCDCLCAVCRAAQLDRLRRHLEAFGLWSWAEAVKGARPAEQSAAVYAAAARCEADIAARRGPWENATDLPAELRTWAAWATPQTVPPHAGAAAARRSDREEPA